MKDLLTYILVLILLLMSVLWIRNIGASWSYEMSYKKLVEKTIREMVKEKAIK